MKPNLGNLTEADIMDLARGHPQRAREEAAQVEAEMAAVGSIAVGRRSGPGGARQEPQQEQQLGQFDGGQHVQAEPTATPAAPDADALTSLAGYVLCIIIAVIMWIVRSW